MTKDEADIEMRLGAMKLKMAAALQEFLLACGPGGFECAMFEIMKLAAHMHRETGGDDELYLQKAYGCLLHAEHDERREAQTFVQ